MADERDDDREEEKSRTRKGDMGGDYDEEIGDEAEFHDTDKDDMDGDQSDEMPHGAHAIHDMHDFYGAGQEAAAGHLKLADNPKLKELLADHADQLAAMASELRELFEEDYPEHPAPEAPAEEMTEEAEDEGDEGMEEKAEDEGDEEEEEHTEKSDALRDSPSKVGTRVGVQNERGGDRVEDERKSRKGVTRKAAPRRGSISRKSWTPTPGMTALERTRERKHERLLQLVEDLLD